MFSNELVPFLSAGEESRVEFEDLKEQEEVRAFILYYWWKSHD